MTASAPPEPLAPNREKPLMLLAALVAATSPELGRDLFERAKDALRGAYAKDPMDAVVGSVLVGSLLFYKAERGTNPKVRSFWDALVYVSTNLSVGYCDIFAMTPAGKAIGSALMTWGPGMAAGIFDPTKAAREAEPAVDARVVERLDRILALLESQARASG